MNKSLLLVFVIASCANSAFSWSSSEVGNTHKSAISRRDAFLSTAVLLPAIASPAMAEDETNAGYETTSRGIKYKVVTPPDDPMSNTPER